MSDDEATQQDAQDENEEERDEGEPVQKVTDEPGGARRDSYFKRRDYEPTRH